jgi:hypothetical protein
MKLNGKKTENNFNGILVVKFESVGPEMQPRCLSIALGDV